MNKYHLDLRHTIVDAYHTLKAIPRDQWHDVGFYDWDTGQSDMMGWYVRTLPEMKDKSPKGISASMFRIKASPLCRAINDLLDYCIPPEDLVMDAYAICPGYHLAFQQDHPFDRSIACLKLIIDKCCGEIPPLDKIPPRIRHANPPPADNAIAGDEPRNSIPGLSKSPAEKYMHKA